MKLLAGRRVKPVLTTPPATLSAVLSRDLGPSIEVDPDFKVDLVDADTGDVVRKGRSWREEQ